MKVAIMIDRSNGNETVGEMWTEVLVFDESATLSEVLIALPEDNEYQIKHNIRLQLAKEPTK